MIINRHAVSNIEKSEMTFAYEGLKFYLKGFVYIDCFSPGIESLKEFAREWRRKDIHYAIQKLKGHFFLYILDNHSNQNYAFIDNSGMFDVVYSNKYISTSFLDLVKNEKLSRNDVDMYVTTAFLNQGAIYFNRTLFQQIKKISSDEILSFKENGEVKVARKQITELEEPSTYNDIYEYFEALTFTLKDRSISVDLTGGIDSRLICTMLNHFDVPFETSVSGSSGDHDVIIADKVAKQINHPLYVTKRPSSLDEKTIKNLFVYGDGLFDVLKVYSAYQSHQEKLNRGIDLVINGTGGELYKDFWWLQDLPFYRKKISDIKKLVNMRIMPIQIPQHYLHKELHDFNLSMRQDLIRDLSKYHSTFNTQTYDQIYYNYSMQHNAGRLITSGNYFFDIYSPLLEREVVKLGYQLPRRKRFNNQFHREVITNINSSIASIETTEGGMTVSAEFNHKLNDNMKYVLNKSKRLTKKVGQKILKQTFLAERYHHDKLFEHVRQLDLVQHSVELLKEEKILNPNLKVNDINNHHLGRIISLALLFEFLHSHQ